MRAIVFDGEVHLRNDYPDPSPRPGEALIRVSLAGICNTDLEIARGYMNFHGVMGHEFVGEVVGAAMPGWLGRRVVGEINAPCLNCEVCRTIGGNHCPHRTVLGIQDRDGTFADLVSVPLSNLHEVPDEVPDESAVFVEPLAAAYNVLEQVHIKPTDKVIVLGDGKLGQLIARVLWHTGASVTAVGKHDEKLALLAESGIAAAKISELGDEYADVVIDSTGSAQGFADAVRLTRPRGTLVLKSTVAEGVNLNLAPVVINEITVVGSRCGPFDAAIRALATGRVDVQPLLQKVVSLDDGEAALVEAARNGVLKVAIQP